MTAVQSRLDRDAEVAERAGLGPASSPVLAATGLVRFGQTEALRGVDNGRTRGDPGGHGTERLGQVHAPPLPRRDPHPRCRRSSPRRRAHRHAGRRGRSRLRRTAFGFVFQFGQLVPELPAIEKRPCPCCSTAGRAGPRSRPPRRGWSAWTGGPRGSPPGRAVRRAGPARRDRAGPRRRTAGRVRGRADRLARLPGGRAGDEPPHRVPPDRRA